VPLRECAAQDGEPFAIVRLRTFQITESLEQVPEVVGIPTGVLVAVPDGAARDVQRAATQGQRLFEPTPLDERE
jgi:hypothetical protein